MNKIILVLSVIAMIDSLVLNPDSFDDRNTGPSSETPLNSNSEEWGKGGIVLDVPTDPPVPCGHDVPCGWGLYDRFSGVVSSYIQNRSCFCAEGTLCYRARNDRQSASFIYLCRDQDPRDTGTFEP